MGGLRDVSAPTEFSLRNTHFIWLIASSCFLALVALIGNCTILVGCLFLPRSALEVENIAWVVGFHSLSVQADL